MDHNSNERRKEEIIYCYAESPKKYADEAAGELLQVLGRGK